MVKEILEAEKKIWTKNYSEKTCLFYSLLLNKKINIAIIKQLHLHVCAWFLFLGFENVKPSSYNLCFFLVEFINSLLGLWYNSYMNSIIHLYVFSTSNKIKA